jgi:hypothetical protein
MHDRRTAARAHAAAAHQRRCRSNAAGRRRGGYYPDSPHGPRIIIRIQFSGTDSSLAGRVSASRDEFGRFPLSPYVECVRGHINMSSLRCGGRSGWLPGQFCPGCRGCRGAMNRSGSKPGTPGGPMGSYRAPNGTPLSEYTPACRWSDQGEHSRRSRDSSDARLRGDSRRMQEPSTAWRAHTPTGEHGVLRSHHTAACEPVVDEAGGPEAIGVSHTHPQRHRRCVVGGWDRMAAVHSSHRTVRTVRYGRCGCVTAERRNCDALIIVAPSGPQDAL